MSPKVWRLSGVGAAVVALVLTWFFAIAPQRRAAAELGVETAAQDAAAADLVSKIELLKKQSAEIPAKEAELSAIARKLPPGIGMPNLVRTITRVGKQTHTLIASIEPGKAIPLTVETTVPAPSASTDGSASESGDAAAPTTRSVSSGLMSVPLTVGVCGKYSQLRNFLAKVEGLPRAVLVTSVDIKRGCETDSKKLSATISASVFALPAKADGQAGTSASGGATGSNQDTSGSASAAKGESPS